MSSCRLLRPPSNKQRELESLIKMLFVMIGKSDNSLSKESAHRKLKKKKETCGLFEFVCKDWSDPVLGENHYN